MVGESTDAVWGVLEVILRTDFPDVRKISIIHSADGTLMNIPREGGYLNRLYLELPQGIDPKTVTLESLHQRTRQVLHPYHVDFPDTVWWSAYCIGRRISDHFTESNRVFLAGDAAHTHSPKAGQGMNISLQDGYNIGWKLAALIKGQVAPDVLHTYVPERRTVAENLIEWDKSWVKHVSSMSPDGEGHPPGPKQEVDLSAIFAKTEAFSAALTIEYADTVVTNSRGSTQSLATNLKVGMRFPSARVIRLCDAHEMHLNRALLADGRWRIIVFAGDIRQEAAAKKLNQVCS